MQTPPVTISADSSDLSTQTPAMNEQPSSMYLTIGESHLTPQKQDSLPSHTNARGVFAFSPYSLLHFYARNRAETGVWKHNSCSRWWCCVHPCGWRLELCAVSCVRHSTGRDKIKWQEMDRSGLELLDCIRKKRFFKRGPKGWRETYLQFRPHHYQTTPGCWLRQLTSYSYLLCLWSLVLAIE